MVKAVSRVVREPSAEGRRVARRGGGLCKILRMDASGVGKRLEVLALKGELPLDDVLIPDAAELLRSDLGADRCDGGLCRTL